MTNHRAATMTKSNTIDMTPTWGEIGLLMTRLALSNEREAIKAGKPEIGRAYGMAEALSKLWGSLSQEQRAKAQAIIEAEAAKVMRA
jgi:hypothetical protein